MHARRLGVQRVVDEGPAQVEEVGPRWRDLAVDPLDADGAAWHADDELDAHADGQDRLPGPRRPGEGDEADHYYYQAKKITRSPQTASRQWAQVRRSAALSM
jgi:hypothetical protein